jgi:hypothetical protein
LTDIYVPAACSYEGKRSRNCCRSTRALQLYEILMSVLTLIKWVKAKLFGISRCCRHEPPAAAASERIEHNRIQRPIFPDTGVHILSSIVGADTVKNKGWHTSWRESGCSQDPGATNCFKEVLVVQVCRGGPQRVCGLAHQGKGKCVYIHYRVL